MCQGCSYFTTSLPGCDKDVISVHSNDKVVTSMLQPCKVVMGLLQPCNFYMGRLTGLVYMCTCIYMIVSCYRHVVALALVPDHDDIMELDQISRMYTPMHIKL